jgi:hypothetical protein
VSSKQRNPANNAHFRQSGALFWQFRVKSRQWRGNHDVGGEYAVYMMACIAFSREVGAGSHEENASKTKD